jgi:hypothetical protein
VTIDVARDRRLMQPALVALARGRSPAGWQLTQRGWVSTLPSSVKMATDRASVSAIEPKLSAEASVLEAVCEAA